MLNIENIFPTATTQKPPTSTPPPPTTTTITTTTEKKGHFSSLKSRGKRELAREFVMETKKQSSTLLNSLGVSSFGLHTFNFSLEGQRYSATLGDEDSNHAQEEVTQKHKNNKNTKTQKHANTENTTQHNTNTTKKN